MPYHREVESLFAQFEKTADGRKRLLIALGEQIKAMKLRLRQ